MINIREYIDARLIITDLKVSSKEEAIQVLVQRLYQKEPKVSSFSQEQVIQEVVEREKLHTTGLGQQTAFPHARIKGWKDFKIVIGISKDPLVFNSLDGLPVHFICLMISSSKAPYLILQSMAAMVRFINSLGPSEIMFQGMNSEEVAEKLKSFELNANKIIRASDLMRPVSVSVQLDSKLEDVSRTMHLNQVDVVPVVDENDLLCGQVSCFDIFSYGLPDFFKNLHTVSFVRHLDPFEKYFKFDSGLQVKDVLDTNCATIDADATLVEIVFELTVKNKLKLFVVKDKCLEGEIDRFSIIDKILFF